MWRWRLYVLLGLAQWFDCGIRSWFLCRSSVTVMAYLHIIIWLTLGLFGILLVIFEDT